MQLIDLLKNNAEKAKLNVSRETLEKLLSYTSMLLKWNKAINLIAKGEESNIERLLLRHILDSLQLSLYIEKSENIIDLGTGAGLPGMVLAIAGYEKVSLVDKNSKKIAFLNEVKAALKLNACVSREDFASLSTSPDVFVSRAVTSIANLVKSVDHLISSTTRFILHKSKNQIIELNELQISYSFNVEKRDNLFNSEGLILIISNVVAK
jgi:16S rRNA (guanine527-N7)-methyltransferase